jgi:hypothetical protein
MTADNGTRHVTSFYNETLLSQSSVRMERKERLHEKEGACACMDNVCVCVCVCVCVLQELALAWTGRYQKVSYFLHAPRAGGPNWHVSSSALLCRPDFKPNFKELDAAELETCQLGPPASAAAA